MKVRNIHGLSANVEEQGFCILDKLFLPSEMERLADEIAHSDLKRSKAGVRHALRHAAVRHLATDPRLLRIANDLLGPAALPFRATLFDKSPQANWLVVWHQDTALPLREKREVSGWGPWSVKDGIIYAHAPASALARVLALRVHLDDSNTDNGPLRVLPGTHANGVLNDEEIERLAAERVPVDCAVPRGGVLVMKPLVVHASSKSHSDSPRRVVHIEYATCAGLGQDLELAIA